MPAPRQGALARLPHCAPWRALRKQTWSSVLFLWTDCCHESAARVSSLSGDKAMRFLDSASRNQRIGWANEVLNVVRDRGDELASSQIQSAIDQYQTAPFSTAVLGKVKRGKSTLINALLGRRDDVAAPIDRLPASSAISRFRWCEQEAVTVLFRDGRKEAIPLTRVREFVTEDFNPQNCKGVELLDIAGPFAGLDRELELVDTPGAGSMTLHSRRVTAPTGRACTKSCRGWHSMGSTTHTSGEPFPPTHPRSNRMI